MPAPLFQAKKKRGQEGVPTNLERMRRFEGNPGQGLPSNVLTMKQVRHQASSKGEPPIQASHYAPTDIPTILEGSRAATLARWLGLIGQEEQVVKLRHTYLTPHHPTSPHITFRT